MAGELARRIGLWPELCQQRQTLLLRKLGLPTELREVPAAELIAAMQMDKKTEHGKINFILPTRIGSVNTVADCQVADIAQAIDGAGS